MTDPVDAIVGAAFVSEHMHHDVEPSPVPVHIVGDSTEKQESATKGIWSSWKLLGTEARFQILPQNSRRKRAVIWVLPGFANNNTVGNVYVGTQGQVNSGTGGIMVSGQSVTVESQSAVWLAPDGTNSLTITVLDEWYL